jgi:archaellum component FlaF (FlaF/FlaG flagellin family)
LVQILPVTSNGDGKLDLAAVDYDNNLAILLGNGDGTFQPQLNTPLSVPVGLAYADVNGDGRFDLVAPTNYYENGPGITILIQSPSVSLIPASIAFGNQHVGSTSSPQKVILTNSGSATLSVSSISTAGLNSGDFQQTNSCGTTLLAGSSCSISVTFSPTATGNRTASVMISDNAAGTPQTVTLTGTGVGAVVALSPLSLDFGSQTVGIASPAQNVTLTNNGNASLIIRKIALSVSDGSVVQANNCGSALGAGDSCTVNLSWTPKATGNMTGNITFTDNATNSPQVLPLSGVGVLPAVTVSPTSLTFPDQVVFRESKAQTITLTNTGSGILAVKNIATTLPFSQTNTCGSSVNAGASCTINVTFRPETIGTLTGAVSIMDNAPGSPQKIVLTGVGTYIQLSPASLNFGDQTVGTTSLPKTITLSNKGSVAVSIDSISITGTNLGDFAQTNTCGTGVAAGASCSITVTFTPSASGRRTASVSVSDSGGGSPQSIALSGVGT